MKLTVKDNKGWGGINRPDATALKHHTGHETIDSYTESSINSRLEWDYNVKYYGNSGDVDNVTKIQWQESPTKASKIGSIISGVLLGGLPVGLLALRERNYQLSFNTSTGTIITEAEAEVIQTLNKELTQTLDTINNELLNENNLDKFDTDLAKEKLNQLKLSSSYQDFSINNKQILNELLQQQLTKEKEMKQHFTQEINGLKQEIKEVRNTQNTQFSSINNKFEEAKRQREEFNRKSTEAFKNLSKEGLESRNKAIDLLNKAIEKSKEQHTAIEKKLIEQNAKLTREVLESRNESTAAHKKSQQGLEKIVKQGDMLDNNMKLEFKKTHEERAKLHNEIKSKLESEFKEVTKEILQSRKEANEKFHEAQKERNKNAEQQKKDFIEVKEQNQKLSQDMKQGFEKAQKEREKIYNDTKTQLQIVEKEILQSRKEANEKFNEAQKERKNNFEQQTNQILELSKGQKLKFEEAMKHSSEIYQKMERHSLNIIEVAKQGFEKASNERKNIYDQTEQNLKKIEQEILTSRNEAEKRFMEASAKRLQYYEQADEMLKKLNNEVLESRRIADQKFDEASNTRLALYLKTAEELGKTQQEVLESRRIADQKFDEATKHREKVHRETDKKIELVNSDVNNLRNECDQSFKEAIKHREEIHTKANEKMELVNSSINNLRNECDQNFETAKNHIQNILKHPNKEMEMLTLKSDAKFNDIKSTLGQIHRASLQQEVEISNLYNQSRDKILSNTKGRILTKSEHNNYVNEINTALEKIATFDDKVKKIAALEGLRKCAVKIATIEGNKYFKNPSSNSERDPLNIKGIIKEIKKLEFSIIKDELEVKQKANIEALKLLCDNTEKEMKNEQVNNFAELNDTDKQPILELSGKLWEAKIDQTILQSNENEALLKIEELSRKLSESMKENQGLMETINIMGEAIINCGNYDTVTEVPLQQYATYVSGGILEINSNE